MVTKLNRRNIIFLFLSLVFMSLDWWAHEQRPGKYKRTTPGLRSSSSIHVLSFVEDWPSVCDSILRWPSSTIPCQGFQRNGQAVPLAGARFSLITKCLWQQTLLGRWVRIKERQIFVPCTPIEMEHVHVHKDKPSAASGTKWNEVDFDFSLYFFSLDWWTIKWMNEMSESPPSKGREIKENTANSFLFNFILCTAGSRKDKREINNNPAVNKEFKIK